MIRWITPDLGTSAKNDVDDPDVDIVDVRHLVDKRGNSGNDVRSAMEEALALLAQGKRVVVCCDYGMSRSNSVAAGVLSIHRGLRFSDAVREVIEKTGERAIRLEVLGDVESALPDLAPKGRTVDARDPAAILVTGGSGFLGRALEAELSGRCKITSPTSAELDLTHGPAQLSLWARDHRISQIVHLANPRIFSTNAVLGPALVSLKNAIDVCRQEGIKLIFVSSWEIYSAYRAQSLFASESLPPNPKGPYGLAKYLCERMLEQESSNDPDFQYSIVRSAPIFGAGSDKPKFIYRFIDQACRGEDIITHRYRNGLPILDLMHISDAVSALAAVVEKGAAGEFNIGAGNGVSTAEVARIIVEIVGSKSTVRHNDINEFTANIVMDSRRAKCVLGWSPVADLRTKLRELIFAMPNCQADLANRN